MAYNEKILGWFKIADFESLEFLVKNVPENGSIIELGSFLGRSTWCMAKTCHPTVQVHCFDLWYDLYYCDKDTVVPGQIANPSEKCVEILQTLNCSLSDLFPQEEKFIENTKGCPNIVRYKMNIQDIDWREDLVDLVFLDAFHSQEREFKTCVRYWKDKIKPNGVISGHDYADYFPEKKMWIDQLANEFSQKVVVRNPKSSVWYFE